MVRPPHQQLLLMATAMQMEMEMEMDMEMATVFMRMEMALLSRSHRQMDMLTAFEVCILLDIMANTQSKLSYIASEAIG